MGAPSGANYWNVDPATAQAEQQLAAQAAQQYGLNQNVFEAMLATESGWQPNINNMQGSGAEGVAQIMPSTAAQPGYGIAPISNPYDYTQAIPFAAQVLSAFGGTTPQGIQRYGTATVGSDAMNNLMQGITANGLNPITGQPETASSAAQSSASNSPSIWSSVTNAVLGSNPITGPAYTAYKTVTGPSFLTEAVFVVIGLGLIYFALHKQLDPVIVNAAKTVAV
jgi:hypothetical protein